MDASLLAVLARNASHDLVKFMVEVVEYLDGWEVLLVQRLPGVNTNPSRAVLYSDPRHVDSVLCGSQEFIEKSRAFRRMVGGNMRQAGPLAAAGIIALENMVARLPEDHRTAKQLAVGLHKIDASIVDPALVETNLVRASVRACKHTAAELSKMLAQKGVRVAPGAGPELRFVTHRHISGADIDAALAAFAECWAQQARA